MKHRKRWLISCCVITIRSFWITFLPTKLDNQKIVYISLPTGVQIRNVYLRFSLNFCEIGEKSSQAWLGPAVRRVAVANGRWGERVDSVKRIPISLNFVTTPHICNFTRIFYLFFNILLKT